MRYAHPGTEGAIVSFKAKYGNYIGGEFVAPVDGNYFTNTSPVNGKPIADFCHQGYFHLRWQRMLLSAWCIQHVPYPSG
jgi:hypothetical protein